MLKFHHLSLPVQKLLQRIPWPQTPLRSACQDLSATFGPAPASSHRRVFCLCSSQTKGTPAFVRSADSVAFSSSYFLLKFCSGPASDPSHTDYWGGFRVINGMWCAAPLHQSFDEHFHRLLLFSFLCFNIIFFIQRLSTARGDVQGKENHAEQRGSRLLYLPASVRTRPRALGRLHVR